MSPRETRIRRPGRGPRPTRRELIGWSLAAAGAVASGCRPRRPGLDVCVIGSGFAGTFLALELARAGLEVAVVEAGGRIAPDESLDGRSEALPLASVGATFYDVDACRTIAVGGTSHKWTGLLLRLSPEDFALGRRHGLATDWPIPYADLEPWYCRAEAALCAAGAAPVRGAEPRRACDYPAVGEFGSAEVETHLAAGRRLRFFPIAYSRRPDGSGPVRLADREIGELERAGATLLERRVALRLVAPDGRRIERLEVIDEAGDRDVIEARAFVVAAGTFESARLLLHSTGETHPRGLGNRSGALGRHFNEHVALHLEVPAGFPAELPPGIYRSLSAVEPMRRAGRHGAGLFLRTLPGSSGVHADPEGDPAADSGLVVDPIALDLYGRPAVALSYGRTALDEDSIGAAEGLLAALAQALGVPPEAWIRTRSVNQHPAGTCRMAARAEDGVVDADLLVHGTENLWVSGASTFPTSGVANPTLTVVALTLRLADRIARIA